jgi:hypothetical protein
MKLYPTILNTAIMLAMSASIAQARLGDTLEQSNRRYHKQGVRVDTNAYGGPSCVIWLVGDWNIEEWFDDGVCTIIHYGRRDNGWLNDSEINTLLNNNRVSGQWTKDQAHGVNEWYNSTDALYAKYFSCPMAPVSGTGRTVSKAVMRFATTNALVTRGLIRDDRSDDQPADRGNTNPPTLQNI